jgi:hypothetical protein
MIFLFIQAPLYAPSLAAKSAKASDILMFCGQTASQLLQPMQAAGRLSSGIELNAIGAINANNPELTVKQCSL